MNGNQITSLPIQDLVALANIKQINLMGNPLGQADIEELKARLPNADIIY